MLRQAAYAQLGGTVASAFAALFVLSTPIAAQQVLSNSAAATYQTAVSRDSVVSNIVHSTILHPTVALQLALLSPALAHPRDTVSYRITFTNLSSDVVLHDATIVDTLPAGLDVLAVPTGATITNRVVTWTLGEVAASGTGELTLRVLASADIHDTVRVNNAASFVTYNASAVRAVAPEVQLVALVVGAMGLQQTADVLEVAIGDNAPFTMVLTNTGSLPLTGVTLHTAVPAGAGYAAQSATGVDSARVQGADLRFYLPGTLMPGASRTVHYRLAVVSAPAAIMQNVSYATAGPVDTRSSDAAAQVHILRGMPMQDRMVIGKVYVDENNNGIQDPGEVGLKGVEIWTDDGEIATTDQDGRFSYRNIRPGHHAFHIDAASLPTGFRIGTDIVSRDLSGWTTPNVDFRVLSTSGKVSAVRLPLAWTLAVHLVGPETAPSGIVTRGPAVPVVAYDVTMDNAYPSLLRGVGMEFNSSLDSAVVMIGDSIVSHGSGNRVMLFPVPPHARVTVHGWGAYVGNTASVALMLNGRTIDQGSDAVTATGAQVDRVIGPIVTGDSLPAPSSVPLDGEVELTLTAPATGWQRVANWKLPAGWDVVTTLITDPGTPTVVPDPRGGAMLTWRLAKPRRNPITLRLKPTNGLSGVALVRLSPLRSAASRDAEKKREFLDGPPVSIFAPEDGTISPTDRLYVGIRGERGLKVTLFDGDSVIGEGPLRIDGLVDFVGTPLAAGPHRLRVKMLNSSGNERWDSITVHVSGVPASFTLAATPFKLTADGSTITTARIRVLDRWGVPVANSPLVTVAVRGAEPVNRDADASSVGIQVRPDVAGWLDLQLKPGRTLMHGAINITSNKVEQSFPLEVLPAAQPLMITASGQAGLGASADASAAVTLRGRLDDRTSVVMSYDSRKLDAGQDAFARTSDPLDPSQYPILGDASQQRSYSASQYAFAARVERGFDWLAFGDLSSAGFGKELRLGGYQRSLPGIAGRVTAGPIVLQAFGSSTSQVLLNKQIRGAGISGPYQLATNVRAGTEQVYLEIRSQDNATRVVSRQAMARYVDYDIDYAGGVLMFKQPVPAADNFGDPVFIVILYEADSGGPKSNVYGVRASLNASSLVPGRLMDSVRIGTTMVHETPGAGGHEVVGADIRFSRTGALDLRGEVARSQGRDSSGIATSLDGALTLLHGGAKLSASYLSIGKEFGSPSNIALQGGTSEFRAGAQVKRGSHEFILAHEWQRFDGVGIERQRTIGTIRESLGSKFKLETALSSDQTLGGTTNDASRSGLLTLHWQPTLRWGMTAEARHQFDYTGALSQPDYVGLGASFEALRGVTLDLRHRQVFLPGQSNGYSVTDLGVHSKLIAGTEAYGTYQIAGIAGGSNAALVGLRNHLRLGQSWALNALFERRVGVDRSAITDPVRALPFAQPEDNYWSAGLGAELLPPKAPYRLSMRAEMRDGNLRSSKLATFAGDISFNRSLALLSREEFLRHDEFVNGVTSAHHRYSGLLGLAFRPVNSSALNVLAKVEAINADTVSGGGLLAAPSSASRTIVATEAIWQPGSHVEFGTRVAYRQTSGTVSYADGSMQPLASQAAFTGFRAAIRMLSVFELRGEGRLLSERTSGLNRYDAAPSLAFMPIKAFEVAGGYRFGDLRDPDFAVNGGPGWFVTFGAQLTERSLSSAADFWRQRIAGPKR